MADPRDGGGWLQRQSCISIPDGIPAVDWQISTVSPDSRQIAWTAGDAIILSDAASGKELRKWHDAAAKNAFLAFAPDGRTLAANGGPYRFYLRLWNLAGPQVQEITSGDEIRSGRDISWLRFTPDGRVFPFAWRWTTPDGRIMIMVTNRRVEALEIVTGKEICEFAGLTETIACAAMSPDGCRLATSAGPTILVWDLQRLASRDQPALAWNADALWRNLACVDAPRGMRTVETLAAAAERAVALLRERLAPVRGPDPRELAAAVADLGSDNYEARQTAEEQLRKWGDLAEPAMRRALAGKPTLEMRRRLDGLSPSGSAPPRRQR